MIFNLVTVDAANAGGWQVPTEDGGFVQIEAPNLIIQQPEEEMVEMEVGEDLHVAEEYDPMAFFAGPADLNQDHQEPDPNVGQAVDSSIIGKFIKTILTDLKSMKSWRFHSKLIDLWVIWQPPGQIIRASVFLVSK